MTLAAIVFSWEISHATVLYTSNGFEDKGSPTFTVGTIVGQNGGGGSWSSVGDSTPSVMVIEKSVVYEGSQAFGLLNSGSATTTRLTLASAPTGDVFLDGYFQPPPVEEVSSVGNSFTLTLRTSANIVLCQIRFLNTGKLGIGSTLNNYIYNQGEFNRLTIGINATTNTYTIYLNGESFAGGQDLALGASYTNLGRIDFSYTSTTTNAGGAYVDNLVIYDTNPIPEPHVAALLGAGLLFLVVLRHRDGWGSVIKVS